METLTPPPVIDPVSFAWSVCISNRTSGEVASASTCPPHTPSAGPSARATTGSRSRNAAMQTQDLIRLSEMFVGGETAECVYHDSGADTNGNENRADRRDRAPR